MKLFQGLQLGKKNVLLILASYIYMNSFFYLWMLCATYNTFVIFVNFINSYWDPTCLIVVIFEVQNTTSLTMAKKKLIHD